MEVYKKSLKRILWWSFCVTFWCFLPCYDSKSRNLNSVSKENQSKKTGFPIRSGEKQKKKKTTQNHPKKMTSARATKAENRSKSPKSKQKMRRTKQQKSSEASIHHQNVNKGNRETRIPESSSKVTGFSAQNQYGSLWNCDLPRIEWSTPDYNF